MENQNIKDNKINLNLYSRQLGIIDLDAMKILIQSKFLIIGLRGLGVEICKNLILEGPNRVDIYDPNYITINDLNSNFFVTEKDLNKIRDETIIERLNQLNQNVECKVLKNTNINGSNYEDELLFITSNIPNYNMIIITEFVSKNTLTIIKN
jgi:ubiquitin-activating enzyme E1